MITGQTLLNWGYKPGKWFKEAIRAANLEPERAKEIVESMCPASILVPLQDSTSLSIGVNIQAFNELEQQNIDAVMKHMTKLATVPTVRKIAVMPDACPSDTRLGYIPVGGVVATENAIHPGMHSSDVCCSVALTVIKQPVDPKQVLDVAMKTTKFGGGGRPENDKWAPSVETLQKFALNPFLKDTLDVAISHFGTQGDGNHFFFVGVQESTGKTAIVTHHGSRKPGALLYKNGIRKAQSIRMKYCPEVSDFNAWLVADSKDGQDYWNALQLIKSWTYENHYAIHREVARRLNVQSEYELWNEHNFCFQKSDGLFYHAKGATPTFSGSLGLIPLNMREPVLVVRGRDNPRSLDFSPHGAGRNLSRKGYLKGLEDRLPEDVVKEQTGNIDVRFFHGTPDLSELPEAYKDASSIVQQIQQFNLGEVVDRILPYGCIMAGDWIKGLQK